MTDTGAIWSNLDYNRLQLPGRTFDKFIFYSNIYHLFTFHSRQITDLSSDIIGPRHEKTCLCNMRTTKAQISLRIRAV